MTDRPRKPTEPAQPGPQGVSPVAAPRLSPGVRLQTDALTRQQVLLFPEGMLQLNAAGAAILELCDGQRSVHDLVAALAQQFSVPPDVLRGDVEAFLLRLRDRRFVQLAEPVEPV